jgi:acetate kinase
MSDHILTVNAGSSSLKFSLFTVADMECLSIGQIEGLGTDPKLTMKDGSGKKVLIDELEGADAVANHAGGLAKIISVIRQHFPQAKISAVGHRVVHGGLKFIAPVRLNDEVLVELSKLNSLAPLHQPHNLAGVRAAIEAFPDAPQVACFDTAFHRAHPFVNDAFALPRELYNEGVRRYGFHGLSMNMSQASSLK